MTGRFRTRSCPSALLVLSFMALSVIDARAQTRTTVRVTNGVNGAQADDHSIPSGLSYDGRYVVFQTAATNVDTRNAPGVFVYDRLSGSYERVNLTSNGTLIDVVFGTGPFLDAFSVALRLGAVSISGNARYVAFTAPSTVVATNPGNPDRPVYDIYVRDRIARTTAKVVSSSLSGPFIVDLEGFHADSARISLDVTGRHLAFTAWSQFDSNTFTGINQVYVLDRDTDRDGTFDEANATSRTRVTRGPSGQPGNGWSYGVVMSADGNHVAFTTDAGNLLPNEFGNPDLENSAIFLADLRTGRLTYASVGVFQAHSPAISDDGRFASFTGEEAGPWVFDAVSRTVVYVNVATDGTHGDNDGATLTSISGDGRLVVFASSSDNLVPDDGNGFVDIFVHDRDADADGVFDEPGGIRTVRATVASDGAESLIDLGPGNTRVSGNGRYVAFGSEAANLAPGDTNSASDVFLHDLLAYQVNKVAGTMQAGRDERQPAVSRNGRFVAFVSDSDSLVIGDTNGAADVFVRERLTDRVVRVSVSSTGPQALAASSSPAISADGRFVAFTSTASNLVSEDTNNAPDVFLHDRDPDQDGIFDEAGVTRTIRVSLAAGNLQASGASGSPSISDDGRFVAFQSAARDLIPNDANGLPDVFLRDVRSGTTTRVSVTATGGDAFGVIGPPSISGDGRYVAFTSSASDLVSGDTNGVEDVFVRDVTQGTTTRVSVSSAGVQGNQASNQPSISQDGSIVAFTSSATTLVSGDTNGVSDVFVRLRNANQTQRVSVGTGNVQANGASSAPSINADGGFVAFVSSAGNLVARDVNQVDDVFLRNRGIGQTTRVSIAGETDSQSPSGTPSISGDGQRIAFSRISGGVIFGRRDGVSGIGPTLSDDGGNSTEVVVRSPTPELTEMLPDRGSMAGGTTITVVGRNLEFEWMSTKRLALGSSPARDLRLTSDTTLNALTGGSDRPGTVDAVMYDTAGLAAARLPGRFTYMAPDAEPATCPDSSYSFAVPQIPVDPRGMRLVVNVTARAGCSWSPVVESNSPWVRLVGAADAGGVTTLTPVGSGTVTFDIAPNDTGAARTAQIVVNSRVLAITQAEIATVGAPPEICGNGTDDDLDGQIDEGCASCSFTVAPATHSFSAAGGAASVTISTAPVCAWTAESETPGFLAVTSTAFGSGNGMVSFAAPANPAGAPRIGTMLIAGQRIVVTQAAGCAYTLSTTSLVAGPRAGALSVSVSTTAADCRWTATAAGFAEVAGGERIGSSTVTIDVPDNHRGLRRQTTVTVAGQAVTVIQRGRIVTGDFDGDGGAELTVFRPANGVWYERSPLLGTTAGVQWGNSADVPVPGDYDGDGRSDVAVFRPGDGVWYLRYSGQAASGFQWGNGADVPLPGDYDGDGRTDIAVFRPGNGIWYLRYATGGMAGFQWGNGADKPVPGDYDGDGLTDLAVFRPASGTWFVRYSATGATAGFQWGNAADVPVPGDYDGDGLTDMAVFRPAVGVWFVRYSGTGSTAGFQWGNAADFPVPGDFDADGRTDLAVWRPSDGVWYLWYSSTGGAAGFQWGNAADAPILKRR